MYKYIDMTTPHTPETIKVISLHTPRCSTSEHLINLIEMIDTIDMMDATEKYKLNAPKKMILYHSPSISPINVQRKLNFDNSSINDIDYNIGNLN
jgi:hypothetical protein